MTTYRGETPEYLDCSLNSLLVCQTCKPDQLVLVVDGPIPDKLDQVIKDRSEEHTSELQSQLS